MVMIGRRDDATGGDKWRSEAERRMVQPREEKEKKSQKKRCNEKWVE